MEMHEITIGSTINEEYGKLFNEFVEKFGEYIVFVSGLQTALLNEKFSAHKGSALYEMQAWFSSKGQNADVFTISGCEVKRDLELLCECLTPKEAADMARKLTERNCDVKLVHTSTGYSVYASGDLPEWAKDDCE